MFVGVPDILQSLLINRFNYCCFVLIRCFLLFLVMAQLDNKARSEIREHKLGRNQPSSLGEHGKLLTPKKALFVLCPHCAPPKKGGTSPNVRESKQKDKLCLAGGHVSSKLRAWIYDQVKQWFKLA